jgi:hypothetical protein
VLTLEIKLIKAICCLIFELMEFLMVIHSAICFRGQMIELLR